MESQLQRNLCLSALYPEISDDPEKDTLLPRKNNERLVHITGHYGTIPDATQNLKSSPSGSENFQQHHHFATIRLIPISLVMGLALGIYEPVIVELLKNRVCEFKFNFTRETCFDLTTLEESLALNVSTTTTAITARLTLLSGLLSSIPCIFVSIFMGSWSDHFGRKMPMTLPFLGFILSALVAILAANYHVHPLVLLASPFCLSLFGGWVVLLMAMFSYLGENVAPENRSLAVAFIDGTIIIGKTCGTFLGGRLMVDHGFTLPLLIFGVLPLSAVVYVLVMIQDRGVYGKASSSCFSVFTFRNLSENVAMLSRKRMGNTRGHILFLLLCGALGLIFTGDQTILQLLTEKAPFFWSVEYFTEFLCAQGIAVGLALMMLTPLFKHLFGLQDATIAIISILSAIISSYGYAVATTTQVLFIATGIGILRSFHVVLVRSMLIPMVDKDELGRIMSVYASMQAVSPLFHCLFFTSVFAATVVWWPGFCFIIGSFALVISLAVFCYIDVDRRKEAYLYRPTKNF